MTVSGRVGEHYEIATLLGSGAMGEVYRAVDRKMFDRTVAIKFLSERLTDSDEGRARFRREITTSARLHHPNIVTIYDWGEHDGRDYFVMEYVDGQDLQGLLKTGIAWDLEQRLDVAFQLADALGFAHRAGVIHRDVKPGNVMVVMSESGLRVKLVDFGIAHVERSNLTQAQSHPGTYSYMSPEQLGGAMELDPRSDLFSLGIVMCELFSGHHPFGARSDAMVANRILSDTPDRPARQGADVPPDLESVILRMLEKDPAQRPSSAREVADALREFSRKVVARSVGADPTFTGLDDLERELVESLVTWARQRELDGAIGDALAAYEKAARLAPESERIQRKIPELAARAAKLRELDVEIREVEHHLNAGRVPAAREALRKAWVIGRHDARLAALEAKISEREALSPEAREREEFIATRMKEIDTALDAGRINDSLAVLTQILRKYPDHAESSVMLDRLVRVAAGGIAYADYRAAVRDASAALQAGDPEAASAARERARVVWPEGPEVAALESEIAAVRHAAVRRARDAEAARVRENEEIARRQHEVLERFVDGARNLLRDARAIRADNAAGAKRAIAAFGKAVKALDLVLSDRPDHPGARELKSEVQAEISALEKRLAVLDPSEAPTVERDPEPAPDRARRERVRAPEPPPAPQRSRFAIGVAVAIGAAVIALGAVALKVMTPDPWATRVNEVMGLPEESAGSVEEKIKRIRAVYVLLPEDDARKGSLSAQEERLGHLDEMYRLIERLEGEMKTGRAENLTGVADKLSVLFAGYRAKLPQDDRTANDLEKSWGALRARIVSR